MVDVFEAFELSVNRCDFERDFSDDVFETGEVPSLPQSLSAIRDRGAHTIAHMHRKPARQAPRIMQSLSLPLSAQTRVASSRWCVYENLCELDESCWIVFCDLPSGLFLRGEYLFYLPIPLFFTSFELGSHPTM